MHVVKLQLCCVPSVQWMNESEMKCGAAQKAIWDVVVIELTGAQS